jgi:hypothetical protein
MKLKWVLGAALSVWGFGSPALASSDMVCEPSWRLGHLDRTGSQTTVMLAPGNDTRANLMLLRLQETGRTLALHHNPDSYSPILNLDGPFYDWDSFLPRPLDPDQDSVVEGRDRYYVNQRCSSDQAGAEDFIAAVEKAGLTASEAEALITARQDLSRFCKDTAQISRPSDFDALAQSPQGQAFARYLAAAWAFYDHDDAAALDQFTALGSQGDGAVVPWVKEASLYMEGRLGAAMARRSGSDDYGMLHYEAVDPALIKRARQAYQTYLSDYPQGRYQAAAANSVDFFDWMTKDSADYSAAFSARWAERLAAPTGTPPSYDDSRLVWYIDTALLTQFKPQDLAQIKDPLLLAVLDLRYMRSGEEEWFCGTDTSFVLSAQDLAAQERYFGDHPALYQMLRATHAFYVAKDPQAVLALIPAQDDMAGQGTLSFTLGMLRGMALDAVNDPQAMAYWQQMLGRASQPGQRPLVELAIGLQAQKALATGGDAAKRDFYALFAPGGALTTPGLRSRLLVTLADAPLLRRQATDSHASQSEREKALFTLLYKDLTWGDAKSFGADYALIPSDLSHDWAGNLLNGRAALGLFTQPRENPDFTCPSVKETAARLAANPKDANAQLCVADLVRLADLDDFVLDHPPPAGVLGGGTSLHAGQPYNRMTTYRRIIDDAKAPANARAYALFRAVRCYAPSSYNHCGGQEAPLAERKAWFTELKRRYPSSRWAKGLKYYW